MIFIPISLLLFSMPKSEKKNFKISDTIIQITELMHANVNNAKVHKSAVISIMYGMTVQFVKFNFTLNAAKNVQLQQKKKNKK